MAGDGMPGDHTVLLLSTADTELLAARACGATYRTGNPARVEPAGLPALLAGVSVVVLRLLGGRRAWPEGVDALVASGRPVVLLGGEAVTRRRADGRVDRAGRGGVGGARLPRRRRAGQPPRAAPVPLRHRSAHR